MSLSYANGKTILVTGGTGSFGTNYVKHLVKDSSAKKIIIFSRDELKQHQMRRAIQDDRLRFFIGDIRDLPRLQRAFYEVDIVVHAAALKQVPTLEYNPFEAVKTNIMGTQNVIDAAIDQGIEKVLLISTDKAAQPVNLYGSTKLCAEKLVINGNAYSRGKTNMSVVRYGNVIGSRGSIIESLMNEKEAKVVYITDERMTRFWINYDQALELVDFTLETMVGGEIVVPKIPSMKLVDLFDALVPGVERKVIGIRPGEKLHEVLVTNEESRHAIELDNHYIILPEDLNMFSADRYNSLLKAGKPLENDFSFASHTNKEWFDKNSIMKMVLVKIE
jgi:UDP-N-acetylglucosamine 4,6-dehydratase/5-epimerase